MNPSSKKSLKPAVRPLLVLIFLIGCLLIFANPARAIVYGVPDGNGHPYVGSMVAELPGNRLFQWCSGTLIAERVFLTASHCTEPIDRFLAANPGARMLVTFDPTITPGGTFYTGTWYTNPNYNNFVGQGGRADPGDIAVIVLDQSPGITPARLPAAGLLDELKSRQALKDTRFTAVGYGTIRETNRTGFAGILDNVDRNRSEQGYLALTQAWLFLPMNLATGNGGTCYGDSGGPHFIHQGGVETNIVVSVTVTGDSPCVATDVTYRTDTPAARAFLGNFVTLP